MIRNTEGKTDPKLWYTFMTMDCELKKTYT